MYQAYLLLKADTDFTLASAQERLTGKFPEATFTEGDGSLVMTTGDWDLSLQLASGPEVLLDSQKMAEQITGAEDDQGIGTCERRVEISSDIPDPEMEYFENFQLVLEAMQSFQGVIAVDPREPCVL